MKRWAIRHNGSRDRDTEWRKAASDGRSASSFLSAPAPARSLLLPLPLPSSSSSPLLCTEFSSRPEQGYTAAATAAQSIAHPDSVPGHLSRGHKAVPVPEFPRDDADGLPLGQMTNAKSASQPGDSRWLYYWLFNNSEATGAQVGSSWAGAVGREPQSCAVRTRLCTPEWTHAHAAPETQEVCKILVELAVVYKGCPEKNADVSAPSCHLGRCMPPGQPSYARTH